MNVRSPLSVSPNSDESGKQSLYADGDPDRDQNLTICSLAHCQPSLKISGKSVWKFLHKVANTQRDRQTNNDENITFLAVVILCGGNENKTSNNKSSAVPDMGDRGHNRHGPKRGGLLCPFRGSWDPV